MTAVAIGGLRRYDDPMGPRSGIYSGRALAVVVVFVLVGCAGGKPGVTRVDGWTAPRDSGVEFYVWPDLWPDTTSTPDVWPAADVAADVGVPTPDLISPDTAPPPDIGPPACPDNYEPNESCAARFNLGSTMEGGSWVSRKATASPASDVDWYRGEGQEESHTCLPFTNQTYYLKVRVTAPAGRRLKVCLYKESCTATPTCATHTTAGSQVELKYKVSGTCAFNDDTTAYFKVEPADGQGGCADYTVAFNYND